MNEKYSIGKYLLTVSCIYCIRKNLGDDFEGARVDELPVGQALRSSRRCEGENDHQTSKDDDIEQSNTERELDFSE